MFKILTDGTEIPQLMLLCDGPCANSCAMTVTPGSEENVNVHQEFAMQAASSGWLVRLDKQLCPAHHQQAIERRSMVKVVPGNFALKH